MNFSRNIPVDRLLLVDRPYRFSIPADILPTLRDRQAKQQPWRDLIDAEDVLHLSLGFGPALFLAFDGRVLVDNSDWDGTGAYEVTDSKMATVAVLYAARRRLPELLRILPPRPSGARECPKCAGLGWLALSPDGQNGVVCEDHCGGLGWLPPTT